MFADWIFPEDWTAWIAALSAVLHQRSAWRLGVLIAGIVFAGGRRTVSRWFQGAEITKPYKAFYYFIGALGRKTEAIATVLFEGMIRRMCQGDERLLVGIDDSPTKRYGPEVEGAGVHHNPTPGPQGAKFLYGHVWVTLSALIRHRRWGTIGLPLLARLYVRAKDVAAMPRHGRVRFHSKLEQAAALTAWAAACCRRAGKALWVVTDGGYTKRGFLKPAIDAGATVVTRLRKDAALHDLPEPVKQRRRGRPRKYGKNRIDLRRQASQKCGWSTVTATLYGRETTKSVKLFHATYRPAGGRIVVLIVREENGSWRAFMCTNPSASAEQILEAVADRCAIEQNFHDLKEVEGIGQQQLRNFWANIGALHLNLWVHTMIEMWAWRKPASVLCDRRHAPWDNAARRPSHADRRRALRQQVLQKTFCETSGHDRKSRKIIRRLHRLLKLTG